MSINNFEFYFKLIAKKYSNKIALIDIDDTKFTYKTRLFKIILQIF